MAIKHSDPDPRKTFNQPPYPEQVQKYPGLQSEMDPVPIDGASEYTGSGRLEGKVAIVTGADSGIGRSVAIAFAKEGADIVVSYLNEDSDANTTKEAVEAAGRKCILISGDIGSQDHCKNIVQQTVDAFDNVDILVNNAAYQMSFGTICEFTTEELDCHFRTNLYPLFYLCSAVLPHMAPGSCIINTASIQAYQPSPNLMPYAMTKAAIVNFTRSFAQQAIEKGIRVNAVAPGPVWTPLIPSTMGLKKGSVPNFGKQSMFQRPAQPIELATLYVFLASSDASYVTAQVFGATGEGMP